MESQFDPYSPFDPQITENPYAIYEQLRAVAPVHYSPTFHYWLISNYEDINFILKNPKAAGGDGRIAALFSNMTQTDRVEVRDLQNSFSLWMLFNDPPVHTRRRSIINKVFTPPIVEHLRPVIENITEELLKSAQGEATPDIIKTFAYPLPILVISEMLGLPRSDRAILKDWSDDVAGFMGTLKRPVDLARTANRSMKDLSEYLGGFVRERRKNPAKDILSYLIEAEDSGQKLTDEEIIATASLILFAGHETTTNLIGNGLLALFNNPEKFAELRKNPEWVPKAVDEFLRYDAPVQIVGRVSIDEIQIRDKFIPKGQVILNLIGSGNRDPKHFSNPGALDFHRLENRHLAFGQGIHFCVGASLARLEAQVAFSKIIEAFPKMERVDEPLVWNMNHGFRGLKHLRVHLM